VISAIATLREFLIGDKRIGLRVALGLMDLRCRWLLRRTRDGHIGMPDNRLPILGFAAVSYPWLLPIEWLSLSLPILSFLSIICGNKPGKRLNVYFGIGEDSHVSSLLALRLTPGVAIAILSLSFPGDAVALSISPLQSAMPPISLGELFQ